MVFIKCSIQFLKKLFESINFVDVWCPHTDSNREPIDYKSIALPIELWGLAEIYKIKKIILQVFKLLSLTLITSILSIGKYDDRPQKRY